MMPSVGEGKYYDFQPIVFYLRNYNRMIGEKYFSPLSKILRFIFFIVNVLKNVQNAITYFSFYILYIFYIYFKLKAKRRKEENNFIFGILRFLSKEAA